MYTASAAEDNNGKFEGEKKNEGGIILLVAIVINKYTRGFPSCFVLNNVLFLRGINRIVCGCCFN